MSQQSHIMPIEDEQEIAATLQLLSAIETDTFRTQRSFSFKLGIALGLTNAYIRRCIKKGWIKMSRAPAKRYAYYITPKGFSEKSRLTADYLAHSFNFFRTARAQCLELFLGCVRGGWQRVVLYGEGELMEIATLAAREAGVELVGVVAPGLDRQRFGGLRVFQKIDELPVCDAVLIADIVQPQAAYDKAVRQFGADRVLAPPLLLIATDKIKGKRD